MVKGGVLGQPAGRLEGLKAMKLKSRGGTIMFSIIFKVSFVLRILPLNHGKPCLNNYCPVRRMGENPSPLGEEFRLIVFTAPRIPGLVF